MRAFRQQSAHTHSFDVPPLVNAAQKLSGRNFKSLILRYCGNEDSVLPHIVLCLLYGWSGGAGTSCGSYTSSSGSFLGNSDNGCCAASGRVCFEYPSKVYARPSIRQLSIMAWVIGNGSFQGWSMPWVCGKCCTLLWCVRWKKFIHCTTNALSFATCSCGGKSANACIAAHTGIATPQSIQCPCREPLPLASISPLAAARINIQPRLVRHAATPSVNQTRGLMYACLG